MESKASIDTTKMKGFETYNKMANKSSIKINWRAEEGNELLYYLKVMNIKHPHLLKINCFKLSNDTIVGIITSLREKYVGAYSYLP